MNKVVRLELEFPDELGRLEFPAALDERLHSLLDKQGEREGLTEAERAEAEGLVKVAEWLTILRLRAERLAREAPVAQ